MIVFKTVLDLRLGVSQVRSGWLAQKSVSNSAVLHLRICAAGCTTCSHGKCQAWRRTYAKMPGVAG